MRGIALGLVLLSCGSADLRAQDASDEVRGMLATFATSLAPELHPVRFHREEGFEDDFVVASEPISSYSRRPQIYKVERAAFERDGDSASRVMVTGGLPTMYVAVSASDKKIYRLAGFPDAEANFNLLVKDQGGQPVRSEMEAEGRGLLCAQVVYGLSSDWWVGDDSGVKLKAAEHFFAESHRDGLALAERWWTAAKGDRTQLKIVTRPMNDGFEVRVPIFWAPVEGHSVPEVKLYRIRVNSTGSCSTVLPSVVLR